MLTNLPPEEKKEIQNLLDCLQNALEAPKQDIEYMKEKADELSDRLHGFIHYHTIVVNQPIEVGFTPDRFSTKTSNTPKKKKK
jgi:cell division septum initiation protein DivIVA